MSRNHLKFVMICWAVLVMAVIWVDHWALSFAFGNVTCALGAVILIAGRASIEREKKESRHIGLVLIAIGSVCTLLEAYDRLVIGHVG